MFVCRYLDPQTETVYFVEGNTVQDSWENLLNMLELDYGLSESEVHVNMIQFFQPAEVCRETRTVWELSE
jgi:hypothetical protein